MMDNQREIINKNINSLKETLNLIIERFNILEEQIKINDKIDNNEELKEVMKENIDEVKNNTNEPKKRGRKPKKIEDKVEKVKANRHINKTYSYYKNSYTDEQREKCKERSRERYYRLKALKGEGLKKDKEEKKKRGRPRINK